MARNTNLKWLQNAGGWASAKMLLDVYGHFLRSESSGFADAITSPNGPIWPQVCDRLEPRRAGRVQARVLL